MQVKSKRKIIRANKIFTDRKEPRDSFWQNYEICKENIRLDNGEIKVLSYYGVGGIGKSALLKKLISEMKNKVEKPQFLYFDFSIKKDSKSVLESIRSKLSKEYGFEFPLFDVTLYSYAQKVGENVSEPEVEALIDKSPVLEWVLSATGMLPGVGVAVQVLTCIDKGFALAKSKFAAHKKELVEIRDMSPMELYDYLPYVFSLDMSENLKNNTEPFVVFFDTYEMLVNELDYVGNPLSKDIWIRGEEGLIQNIPNVLWVIAGREKLKWTKFDSDWEEVLDQHILGELSRQDANNFLSAAGIEDLLLIEQIYQLTNGTPVYLDLCVDTYYKILEQNKVPQISDFGNNIDSLVERFVRYMPPNMKELVYSLACLGDWDDRMLSELGPRIISSFYVLMCDEVKQYSFVTKVDDNNYSILQTIRTLLAESCPEGIRNKTFTEAIHFIDAKLSDCNVLSEDYEYYLKKLIYYGLHFYESEEQLDIFYVEKTDGRIRALIESGKVKEADSALTPFWIKARENPESALYIYVATTFSYVLQEETDYEESLKLIMDVYHKCKEWLGDNDIVTINKLAAMVITLSKKGHFKEALEYQKEVYEKLKQNYGDDHADTIIALDNYAACLGECGSYDEALEYGKIVYEKLVNTLGEADVRTLHTLSNLAETMEKIGRREEALYYRKQVYEKRKNILGDSHLLTVEAGWNIGATLCNLGRYEEALRYHEMVYERLVDLLGENHPDTLKVLSNKADILLALKRKEEALIVTSDI